MKSFPIYLAANPLMDRKSEADLVQKLRLAQGPVLVRSNRL